MRDPRSQSTEANPKDRAAADQLQMAIRSALASLEATRWRLLFDASRFEPGRPPLVDGRPAIVNGEPLSLVEWLRNRIDDFCRLGTLVDALEELQHQADDDPLDSVAYYVREDRATARRLERRNSGRER